MGKLPTFFVIGAARSGTTSLYYYLQQHPDVFLSPIKEPHYFAYGDEELGFDGPGDAHYWQSASKADIARLEGSVPTCVPADLGAYQSLFSRAGTATAIGECSVFNLFRSERSAPRIKELVPDAKIIVMLRHPIDRALSHYSMMRRSGRERERTFLAAVRREAERAERGWSPDWQYLTVSRYGQQLKPYFDAFGADSIRIYLFEEFMSDTQTVVKDILQFVGANSDYPISTAKRYNVSYVARSLLAHRVLKRLGGLRIGGGGISAKAINWCIERAIRANYYRPTLNTDQRRKLIGYFEDDIRSLQRLVDQDLSSWFVG